MTPRRIVRCGWHVLAAAALTLTAAAVAPSGAAIAAPTPPPRSATAGGVGLRLLDAPAIAMDDPRARLYIIDHVAPGHAIRRRIEIANTTAAASHVVLYTAAASIAHGSFLGADGHTPNDLSTWTAVDPGSTDVPAGGRRTATVTVTVPSDAAPGEQYAVVWAEVRSTATNVDVTTVNRVGVRIYLSVGPGGPPAADFTIDTLTTEHTTDGRPTIRAMVHNSGGRALDVSGTLRLTAGPSGLNAGPFPATLGTTLGTGDTAPVRIILDRGLPDGPWNAEITLSSGLLTRSTQATITFPAVGVTTAAAIATRPVKAGPLGWLYPAIGGAIALVIAVAVLMGRTRRQRRHPRQPTSGHSRSLARAGGTPRRPGPERP